MAHHMTTLHIHMTVTWHIASPHYTNIHQSCHITWPHNTYICQSHDHNTRHTQLLASLWSLQPVYSAPVTRHLMMHHMPHHHTTLQAPFMNVLVSHMTCQMTTLYTHLPIRWHIMWPQHTKRPATWPPWTTYTWLNYPTMWETQLVWIIKVLR